ncbi:hypothetical protein [Gordonia humi]|uniref:Heme/copper-type cytochrome/quinol oxidase subunit 4 n=1 Tax=Gordonia humi TaxID=686429 RepID=A0A840EYY6_9ACTN|nr:hypothetical protein [Gordonia humi]MBB4135528.1 heme/copper-type cytochrome/quinol oxidase subunit 4 [Gordonia humi]
MPADLVPARVRGGVVGGASALTGIAAHAAAMGILPSTSSLLIVLAAAVAIGAAVVAAPRLPGIVALAIGQGAVHLLLTLLSGHHHDLLQPSMVLTHGLGTVAALALIAAIEALASTAIGVVALVVSLLTYRGMRRSSMRPRVVRIIDAPAAPLQLGSVGLRGPPAR